MTSQLCTCNWSFASWCRALFLLRSPRPLLFHGFFPLNIPSPVLPAHPLPPSPEAPRAARLMGVLQVGLAWHGLGSLPCFSLSNWGFSTCHEPLSPSGLG